MGTVSKETVVLCRWEIDKPDSCLWIIIVMFSFLFPMTLPPCETTTSLPLVGSRPNELAAIGQASNSSNKAGRGGG